MTDDQRRQGIEMIEIRYRGVGLAVMLIATVLPVRGICQSPAERGGDVTELLEMELSDVKRENARLMAELEKARAANAKSGGGDFSILKKENDLLKDAIIKLDKKADDLSASLQASNRELERVQSELEKARKKCGVNGANVKDLREMQARCRNLDDENAILKAEVDKQRVLLKDAQEQSAKLNERCLKLEADARKLAGNSEESREEVKMLRQEIKALKAKVAAGEAALKKAQRRRVDRKSAELATKIEEMQAVEAQRKEAFDKLFKDLADLKRQIKQKDDEISEVKAEHEGQKKLLRAKDSQIVELQSRISKLQVKANQHAAEVAKLQEAVEDAAELSAQKERAVKQVMAERQAVEVELSRIKMTDEQRKRAMDEVLEKLAAAENRNQEDAAKIKGLQERLSTLEVSSADEIRGLKATLKDAQNRQAQLELDLQSATAARDDLMAKLQKDKSVAEKDAAKIVELEGELARMKATDTQRKKSMDKLLLELSQTEEMRAKDQEEVRSARQELEAMRLKMNGLQQKAARVESQDKTIADLRSRIAAMQEDILKQKGLEDANADLKHQVELLGRRLEEAQSSQEEIVLLNRQLDDLQGELDDARKELAQARSGGKEAGDLRRQVEGLQAELKLAQSKLADAESDSQRAEELKRQVASLTGELEMAKVIASDSSELKKELGELQGELVRAKSRIKELEEAEQAARCDPAQAERLAELQKENGSLREQVNSLQARLSETEERLADADKRVAKAEAELKTAREEGAGVKSLAEMERRQWQNAEAELNKTVAGLKAEISDLNARIKQQDKALKEQSGLADKLKSDLEKAGKERGECDKRRAELEREIGKLKKQIADLKQDLVQAQRQLKQVKSELAKAQEEKGALAADVKRLKNRKIDVRQTPLFKELEQVNVTLREKIVQIEGERQRLARDVKKLEKRADRYDDDIDHEKALRKKAESALADGRAREVEYKELIERYMAQIPKLEGEITDLSDKLAETKKQLRSRQEEVQALKIELEKREHRLVKAERVAEILNKSREEVLHASDKDKLNIYYNMAAVYAKDGKYRDAEREYLRALKINPMDADIHYNLGILYDDELNEPEKAMMHYRRYLKLNPHGPDAENVRNWLLRLEMKSR